MGAHAVFRGAKHNGLAATRLGVPLLIALLIMAALLASWSSGGGYGPSRAGVASAGMQAGELQERYLHLMEQAVTGVLVDELGSCIPKKFNCWKLDEVDPFNAEMRLKGNDWPPAGHTMVGQLRIRNIKQAITEVVAAGVPGDFVELGVWRGGASIYAKAVLDVLGQRQRKVYLFDVFGKIPGYDNEAVSDFLGVSDATVKHNFDKYGLLDDRVVLVKGFMEQTVPDFVREHPDTKFAVLRVDGNFYSAYTAVLYALYERVPVGGAVIFDDVMSSSEIMRAWLDFKGDQGLPETLTRIDDHSAWFRKTLDVKVDQSKMRKPQDVSDPTRPPQGREG